MKLIGEYWPLAPFFPGLKDFVGHIIYSIPTFDDKLQVYAPQLLSEPIPEKFLAEPTGSEISVKKEPGVERANSSSSSSNRDTRDRRDSILKKSSHGSDSHQLTKEIDKLKSEKDQLEVATKKLIDERNNLLKEANQIDMLKKELSELKSKNVGELNQSQQPKLEKPSDQQDSQLEKLRAANDTLRGVIEALQRDKQTELNELMTQKDEEQKKLQLTVDNLHEEIQKINKESNSQLDKFKDANLQIVALTEENTKLSQLQTDTQNENLNLTQLNETLKKEKGQLNEDFSKVEETNDALERDNNKLNATIVELTKTIESLKLDRNELNASTIQISDNLKKDHDLLSEANNSLSQNLDTLKKANEELKEANENLNSDFNQLREDNKRLNNSNTDLDQRNNNLQTENSKLNEVNKSQKEEIERIKMEFGSLEKEVINSKEVNRKLNEEMKQLKEEFKSLQVSNKKIDHQLTALKTENENLKKFEILQNELSIKYNTLAEDSNAREISKSKELQEIMGEKNSLLKKISTLESNLEISKTDVNNLKNQNNSLKQSLDVAKSEADQNFKNNLGGYLTTIEELKKEKEKITTEKVFLLKKNADLEEKFKAKNTMIEDVNKELKLALEREQAYKQSYIEVKDCVDISFPAKVILNTRPIDDNEKKKAGIVSQFAFSLVDTAHRSPIFVWVEESLAKRLRELYEEGHTYVEFEAVLLAEQELVGTIIEPVKK
jgi:chromosome segregation ATPase